MQFFTLESIADAIADRIMGRSVVEAPAPEPEPEPLPVIKAEIDQNGWQSEYTYSDLDELLSAAASYGDLYFRKGTTVTLTVA